jgi:hypothetical protein
MRKKLSDEDGRIVDLLLDHGRSEERAAIMSIHSTNIPPPKIRTIEELLSLLHEMRAEEPPEDLATKTLRRIEEEASAKPPPSPLDEGSQPIAG